MSTISSPRLSVASVRSPTSESLPRPSISDLRRAVSPSASAPASTRTASPAAVTSQRRKREALRDYYNLQASRPDATAAAAAAAVAAGAASAEESAAAPGAGSGAGQPVASSTDLDNPAFSPEAYVAHLLATSSLPTLIKAESSLLTDVRTLDGEKKALVYDNYAKLIKAVETIGRMRAGQPSAVTGELAPAIDRVTEAAAALIKRGLLACDPKEPAAIDCIVACWLA